MKYTQLMEMSFNNKTKENVLELKKTIELEMLASFFYFATVFIIISCMSNAVVFISK
jgi:hypothetical protein